MPNQPALSKVSIPEKFDSFSDHWAPRIIARYNDNEVRLVKVDGEFIWHKHDETDELFLILDGTLEMELRDRTVTLEAGELFVVPRGTETPPLCAQRRSEADADRPKGLAQHGRRRDGDQGSGNLAEE